MNSGPPACAGTHAGNILLVKLSSLGDLFHALPLAHALKTAGSVRLTWVTQPPYGNLVANCFQDADQVLLFPRNRPGAWPSFIQRLRGNAYRLACDAQGLLKSALVVRAARTRQRVGPAHAREGAGFFYTQRPPARPRRHAVDEALDLLEPLGVARPREPCFPVTFPTIKVSAAAPRIAVAPCSRWPSKNWPRESFRELLRQLRDRLDAALFIVGGPEDRATGHALADGMPGAENLCGRTTLPELGGWLAAMDLLITVDSGPMHMAAAAGTRVLALFGPTDPRRTGPYGSRHRVLEAQTPCLRPCRNRHCPTCRKALAQISPPEVLAAAEALLGR